MLLPTISTETTLRVLSLNLWGLYVAPDRLVRLSAFSSALLSESTPYDMVAVQELWLKADYRRLVQCLAHVYPHTTYFYSGAVGSGLALFSRYPIAQTHFFPYVLGGKPERVWHGDWYAGKGIGVAVLRVAGTVVSVVNTHMVAAYNGTGQEDIYVTHRLAETYQLMRVCQLVAASTSSVLVVGDLNQEVSSLAYRLLLQSQGLVSVLAAEGTFNRGENTYGDASKPPIGIDYILYVPDGPLRLQHATVAFTEPITGRGVSYSDHCAVEATFLVSAARSKRLHAQELDAGLLCEASALMETAVVRLQQARRWWCISATVVLVVLLVFVLSGSRWQSSRANELLVGAACLFGVVALVWSNLVLPTEINGHWQILEGLLVD